MVEFTHKFILNHLVYLFLLQLTSIGSQELQTKLFTSLVTNMSIDTWLLFHTQERLFIFIPIS